MQRPTFLNRRHENVVEAFNALSDADKVAVERWIIWATCYGSMSWQEQILSKWLDNVA